MIRRKCDMSKALLAGFVIFFLQYDFTFVCIYEVLCRLESLIANIVTWLKQNFKQKLSLTLSHSLLYYGKSKCNPNMREICIHLLNFFIFILWHKTIQTSQEDMAMR